eukprot:TRINITY_DN6266_c1_g3_i3.p1 TRINITY_DN6266_c1_g3~~TRINITY_DN6266_c1_g3_i3.p1  ORF type:complete len:133 (-),score=50.88 TRINITY_DN6266_c1_g3_i3:28-426(-)
MGYKQPLDVSKTLAECGVTGKEEDFVWYVFKKITLFDITFDGETKEEVQLYLPSRWDPLPFSQLKEDIALIFGVDAKEIGSIMRTGNTKLNDDEAGEGNEVKEGDQEEDDLVTEILSWAMLRHGDVLEVERT